MTKPTPPISIERLLNSAFAVDAMLPLVFHRVRQPRPAQQQHRFPHDLFLGLPGGRYEDRARLGCSRKRRASPAVARPIPATSLPSRLIHETAFKSDGCPHRLRSEVK